MQKKRKSSLQMATLLDLEGTGRIATPHQALVDGALVWQGPASDTLRADTHKQDQPTNQASTLCNGSRVDPSAVPHLLPPSLPPTPSQLCMGFMCRPYPCQPLVLHRFFASRCNVNLHAAWVQALSVTGFVIICFRRSKQLKRLAWSPSANLFNNPTTVHGEVSFTSSHAATVYRQIGNSCGC